MAENQKPSLVPTFKIHSQLNPRKTKEQGRPIYDDMEIVEIRTAGDRNSVKVFPAHEVSHLEELEDGGSGDPVTYAMRFQAQYDRFKAGHTQAQSGTPLEEAPFLTQSKRLELKAVHVHTVEALALLDGGPLKALGIGGRELKNQAQAYLDNAKGSADVTRMAQENEALKRQLADLVSQQQAPVAPAVEPGSFEAMPDEELKAFIGTKTGSRPRGQPSHDTLVRMAKELMEAEAA
jgi:hypothetical protein